MLVLYYYNMMYKCISDSKIIITYNKMLNRYYQLSILPTTQEISCFYPLYEALCFNSNLRYCAELH